MSRPVVAACVGAALLIAALAPTTLAKQPPRGAPPRAHQGDDECAKLPKLGQHGASQGNGNKNGHVKREEQSLRCLTRSGQGVARADFNGDGFGDLAIGVPDENVGAAQLANAGAVNVIYGSATGLTDVGNQFLIQVQSQAGGDSPEADDRFGSALAGGDFNNDGRADLAVGAPGEDVGTITNAGNVMVFYGTPTGLTHINPSGGIQVFTQASPGVPGDPAAEDQFGFALTWGDFGRGPQGDLAIGVPGEAVLAGGFLRAGAGVVDVLYGTATGLSGTGAQVFSQATIAAANPSIGDTAEAGDRFGASLTGGNFGPDAGDDLVVGAPLENVGTVSDAGAVDTLYSTSTGLSATGAQFINQDSTGAEDVAETDDQFGAALAMAGYQNFNTTNSPQGGHVVVGVPLENVGSVSDAGAVQSFALSVNGRVSVDSDRVWTQGSPGCTGLCVSGGDNTLADTPETGDRFGSSLALNDFDGNGFKDLAIGAPFEDTPAGAFNVPDAGAVHVLYARSNTIGHSGLDDQFFTQDTGTVQEEAGIGDQFGTALSAWNFGRGPNSDLAIGTPFDDIGDPIEPTADERDVGVVNVLYAGNPGRLSDVGNQLWHQGIGAILDEPEQGDHFGRVEY